MEPCQPSPVRTSDISQRVLQTLKDYGILEENLACLAEDADFLQFCSDWEDFLRHSNDGLLVFDQKHAIFGLERNIKGFRQWPIPMKVCLCRIVEKNIESNARKLQINLIRNKETNYYGEFDMAEDYDDFFLSTSNPKTLSILKTAKLDAVNANHVSYELEGGKREVLRKYFRTSFPKQTQCLRFINIDGFGRINKVRIGLYLNSLSKMLYKVTKSVHLGAFFINRNNSKECLAFSKM
ncbi:unnamed protein product [Moneuplotes crassus]|uniref:Uncharacterized protein n=1 Tax=Euplotes crassus TaxID=5936 RepID=A0AAD1XNY1_EUPCR|nr:unnamed protein product [Moneuplotes crassus]